MYQRNNREYYPPQYQRNTPPNDSYRHRAWESNGNSYNNNPKPAYQQPAQMPYNPPFQEPVYRSEYDAVNQYAPKRTEFDYKNWTLNDFRGKIEQEAFFSAARKTILKLYSGKTPENWVIKEILDCFSTLIKAKAGITFIANIYSKTKFYNAQFIEEIIRCSDQIMQFPPSGFKLLKGVIDSEPSTTLTPFIRCCVEKFHITNDLDFYDMMCSLIRFKWDVPLEFVTLMDLKIYLRQPLASCVACTLIEYADQSSPQVMTFIDDVIHNYQSLLGLPELSNILQTAIIKSSPANRTTIIQMFSMRYEEFIFHSFLWKLMETMLMVGTMPQKHILADAIIRTILNFKDRQPPDILLKRALQSVDQAKKFQYLSQLGSFIMTPMATTLYPNTIEYIRSFKFINSIKTWE